MKNNFIIPAEVMEDAVNKMLTFVSAYNDTGNEIYRAKYDAASDILAELGWTFYIDQTEDKILHVTGNCGNARFEYYESNFKKFCDDSRKIDE